MTAENAALQIAINLRENVANAQQQVDQAEQNLVLAYEREISTLESRKSVYQDNIDTANDLAETWKGLTETLRESADELLGVGVGEPAASRSSFQQTLTAALGGDREAFEELPQLATDLSEAERSQAGTLAEARRANATIASELDKAADQAEDQYLEQLSEKQIAQRSLDRLNKQINQNNKQIDKLTEQELTLDQAKAAVSKAEATLKSAQDASTQAINKLQELLPDSIVNGLMEPLSPLEQIDASTKAMVNLLGQLKSGFKVDEDGEGVESDTFLQISKIYEDELGRAADVTGLAFYESIAESEGLDEVVDQIGSSAEAAITDAYRDALGRDPDPTGRKFYLEQVESGKSIEQIEKEIAASQESQGFADGGIASGPMSGFQATLHGTEAVIPLNGQRIPLEVNNQEMIQELRDLRQEVSQLRTEQGQSQYQIARNTKRTKDTLEQFDIEGLPPERSEV
jgi:prefoldin subunit 5